MHRRSAWSPAPGVRVRLHPRLDRPRVLDGEYGTVRYSWPFVSDEFHWLVALDQPVTDGQRLYTAILCSGDELEPATVCEETVDGERAAERSRSVSPTGEDGAASEDPGCPAPAKPASSCSRRVGWPASGPASEIITYRRSTAFVGRAKELAEFRHNLTLSLDDDRRRFIFNISGASGIGKTWLLQRYAEEFRRTGGVVVWADDSLEDVVDVMEQIVGQLAAQGWRFEAFDEELRRYRQYWRGIQPWRADQPPEAMAGPRETIGSTALVPLADLHDDHYDDVATDLRSLAIPDPLLATMASIGPLRRAVQVLTPLFLRCLQNVAEVRPVGLFFDGYDRTAPFLDSWLRSILNGQYGDLPGTTILAIAGQTPLDRTTWSCFDSILARVPLGPLSDEEVRGLLLHHWILDHRAVKTIQHVSGHLPVLVATMAVRASDRQECLADPSRSALDYFLAMLGDPARRAVALAAAVPRHLDVDVLQVVVDDENAIALVDWLRKMPFVERRGGAWTYRRAVREILLHYVRDAAPDRWGKLHQRVAEYYERLDADLEREPSSPLRAMTRQTYATEALYHRLCQDAAGYRAQALNGFVACFGGDQMGARRWAEAICEAGQDAADQVTRLWGERFLQSIEAFIYRRYGSVAKTFDALLATGCLDPANRRRALAWQAQLSSKTRMFDLPSAAYGRLPNDVASDLSTGPGQDLTFSPLVCDREELDGIAEAASLASPASTAF